MTTSEIRGTYPGVIETLQRSFRAFLTPNIPFLTYHISHNTQFTCGEDAWYFLKGDAIGVEVAAVEESPEVRYHPDPIGGDLIFLADQTWLDLLEEMCILGGGLIPPSDQRYGFPCSHYERAMEEATQSQVKCGIIDRIGELA